MFPSHQKLCKFLLDPSRVAEVKADIRRNFILVHIYETSKKPTYEKRNISTG